MIKHPSVMCIRECIHTYTLRAYHTPAEIQSVAVVRSVAVCVAFLIAVATVVVVLVVKVLAWPVETFAIDVRVDVVVDMVTAVAIVLGFAMAASLLVI